MSTPKYVYDVKSRRKDKNQDDAERRLQQTLNFYTSHGYRLHTILEEFIIFEKVLLPDITDAVWGYLNSGKPCGLSGFSIFYLKSTI